MLTTKPPSSPPRPLPPGPESWGKGWGGWPPGPESWGNGWGGCRANLKLKPEPAFRQAQVLLKISLGGEAAQGVITE